MRYSVGALGVMLAMVISSCAPAPNQSQSQATVAATAQPAPTRKLVVAHRNSYPTLAAKVLHSSGSLSTMRLFNAALTLIDDTGQARPYLAETLPQLNTDSWRVFPDGRMETTYRLRNNLTWQDGAPLTADDFAFALRVYKHPDLGPFSRTPQDQIDDIVAPDARTVVVQWRSPSPYGGSLGFEELDPLPSHLLTSMFGDYVEGRTTREGFMSDPVWTAEYVGAGPYRLERWDPGVQLEGLAFAGHALGRPKIERLIVRIFTDENGLLAAVLTGGTVDYTCCSTLRFEHYVTLKREWEAAGKGTAISMSSTAVFLALQQRPDYVGHEGLLDLRVRRALAHAIDRQALNDGLYDGLGTTTETPAPPTVPFYPELDRMLTRYPLDLNRATALMGEAGYTRDAGGFFAERQGRRFFVDFAVQDGAENQRMQAILSDSWKTASFEVHPVVINRQVFSQLESRHTLPGLGYGFFAGEQSFRSSEVGTPANRWAGSNRSGWISPEYDRLWESATSTLDLTDRGRYIAQMMALVSENLPGYALYFVQDVYSWASALQGPSSKDTPAFGQTVRPTTPYWNIYDWTLR
jgi:peptide/nickel transport system substrate-binding protein